MRALLVFGARPNFMKIAPVYRAMLERRGFEPVMVHTGQHYDPEMSEEFIRTLELPAPDVHLDVGSGTQAWQIAEVVKRLETEIERVCPDVTVVVGDVNSTLAGALCSHTVGVPVAHVEAGLRSRDWTMPEERNRVLTDRLSRYLFTPSEDAGTNLAAEGIEPASVFFVGNVMIDSLDWLIPRLPREDVQRAFGVAGHPYGLVTLHRPGNVDRPEVLGGILDALGRVAADVPLLFPVHPRTRARLAGSAQPSGDIRLLPPLSYSEFVALMADAAIVLTDSGGIQEEATVLGVPCLTLRDNTERPVTLESGVNELVGTDPARIEEAAHRRLRAPRVAPYRPPLWDGHTAERIVDVLADASP